MLSMDSIPLAAAQLNLSDLLDRVSENREPVVVRRRDGKSVVLVSLAEYRSMEETSYLLGSRNNARRLLEGISEMERGDEEQLNSCAGSG